MVGLCRGKSVNCLNTGMHAVYRYGFFWYFYQDGTIQHEVKLTGILSTNGLSEGEVRACIDCSTICEDGSQGLR